MELNLRTGVIPVRGGVFSIPLGISPVGVGGQFVSGVTGFTVANLAFADQLKYQQVLKDRSIKKLSAFPYIQAELSQPDFSGNDAAVLAKLVDLNQTQVLGFWENDLAKGIMTGIEKKRGLIRQLTDIEEFMGLQAVVDRQQKYLGIGKYEGINPETAVSRTAEKFPPEIIRNNQPESKKGALEAFQNLDQTVVRVVAGGTKERMGLGMPMGAFEFFPISRQTLFGLFADSLHALRNYYYLVNEGKVENPVVDIPMALMTSQPNDVQTKEVLAANQYFGVGEANLPTFKQICNPVCDKDGNWLMKGKYEIFVKPHGHGDLSYAYTELYGLKNALKRRYAFNIQTENPGALSPQDALRIWGLGMFKGAFFGFETGEAIFREPSGRIFLIRDKNNRWYVYNVEYKFFDTQSINEKSFENDPELEGKEKQVIEHLKTAGYIDKLGEPGDKFLPDRQKFSLAGEYTEKALDTIFEHLLGCVVNKELDLAGKSANYNRLFVDLDTEEKILKQDKFPGEILTNKQETCLVFKDGTIEQKSITTYRLEAQMQGLAEAVNVASRNDQHKPFVYENNRFRAFIPIKKNFWSNLAAAIEKEMEKKYKTANPAYNFWEDNNLSKPDPKIEDQLNIERLQKVVAVYQQAGGKVDQVIEKARLADTPEQVWLDYIDTLCRWLLTAENMQIPFVKYKRLGTSLNRFEDVVIEYSRLFAESAETVAQKVSGWEIAAGSRLYLSGFHADVRNLRMSGALNIEVENQIGEKDPDTGYITPNWKRAGKVKIDRLTVFNAGREMDKADYAGIEIWHGGYKAGGQELKFIVKGNGELEIKDIFIGPEDDILDQPYIVPDGERHIFSSDNIQAKGYRIDVVPLKDGEPTWHYGVTLISDENDPALFKIHKLDGSLKKQHEE